MMQQTIVTGHRPLVVIALLAAGLCCCAVAARAAEDTPQRPAAADGLRPGMVLDRSTAALAKDLLPKEILRHYERGEYRNKIASWPPGKGSMGPDFEAQTRRNATTLTVNDVGTILDKATGKQPPFVYGVPFPEIDPADPKAGIKVVWNQFYVYWWNGNNRTLTDLVWLSPGGVDRKVTQDVYFKYYDGVPPSFRASNPNNLMLQFLSRTTAPADLNGVVALTWRYRDSDQRDSVWAYVPALRRVRAVSPANRSDGFLGSDMSQDDGPFFDGKPEDFSWKLVAAKDVLRLVDPYRLDGMHKTAPYRRGGWRAVFEHVSSYGFEDPAWNGISWAPVAMVLARRKAWVVEGTPKDGQYLFGKVQLWIDRENWQGIYNRKFSWRGELLNTLQIHSGPGAKDNGEYYTWKSPSVLAEIAENLKMNRATVASFGPDLDRHMVVYHIPLKPSFFDQASLTRFGK